jgi:hypothetical protein
MEAVAESEIDHAVPSPKGTTDFALRQSTDVGCSRRRHKDDADRFIKHVNLE